MSGTTPHLGLPYPTSTDLVSNGPSVIQSLATALDGSALYQQGTYAARPATVPASGNLYYATDTDQLFVSNGTAWQAIAPADAAAGTASMRTLGTGAQQACAGNDSRLQAGNAVGVFSAYLSDATFTLAAGTTWTKVKLNSKAFDKSTWFDSATNWRYTPLVAGYYRIAALVSLTDPLASGEFLEVGIYKNGSLYALLDTTFSPGTLPISAAGDVLVQANGSSDYFELWAAQSDVSSRRLFADAFHTYLCGELVGLA